jgi:hypothetical protein
VFATTYPVDFHFAKNNINGTGDWYVRDRLRGGNNYLNTNDPRAQSSHAYNNEFDHMDGIYTTTALDNTSVIGYEFRRAPGFMDVVTYAGLGSPQNINHNLGVAPELIIVKGIDYSVRWAVWYNGIGTDASGYNKYLALNQTDGDITGGSVWLDMVPTASVFRPNDAFVNEAPRNYVGYLFASASGISKVGTYSGTGSDLNVDCGFSSGARFVLIKRTDSTGDWYVYDSVRGIVAGNDPYLFVNSNAAGVTTTDYIDPLSSGFTITSSAPAALNASGGTYLFLAIA